MTEKLVNLIVRESNLHGAALSALQQRASRKLCDKHGILTHLHGLDMSHTCMVYPQASLEHLLEPEDLGQAPVPPLQPSHRLLHKDVDVRLLRGCGQVQAIQVVRHLVYALAAEHKHHHRQQLPAQSKDTILLLLVLLLTSSVSSFPILAVPAHF